MSIIQGLSGAAASNPEKTATICGDSRLTFRQVVERVNRLSNALESLGIRGGDRVAVLAFNCHRFFEFYYAVPRMGA